MTQKTMIEQHSVLKSLILHLLPGILIGTAYFLLLQPMERMGYPGMAALMVSVALILIPFELGYLIYQGYRRNGKLSLNGLIAYRKNLPFWQYLIWVPLTLIVVGLIFTGLKPVDQFLQNNLFAWIPPMESGLQGGFSKNALILTYTLTAVFGAVLAPAVEELYFRGYLLPRMQYAGKWAPLLHSFLFALYHVFTPWMIVTRTLGMLPMIYVIRKKNILVGIIVHILVNLIDVIAGISFILAMTA